MKHLKTILLAAAMCLGGIAIASNVAGQIMLSNGKPARSAVIWLQGEQHGKPMTNVVINQKDLTFSPHITAITVGTTVRFPNNDTVYHNVFAEFEAKRFDFGMYPQGTSKSKLFDKPGMVSLLCTVHSNMSAYIMVVDTPFFAVTDKNGNFVLKNVEEGNYTLHVWHESKESVREPLKVTDSPSNLHLTTAR